MHASVNPKYYTIATGKEGNPRKSLGKWVRGPLPAAPVQHNVAPVQHNAAPVQHNAAPVHQNAAPVQHNAAPVQQNAAPVSQKKYGEVRKSSNSLVNYLAITKIY